MNFFEEIIRELSKKQYSNKEIQKLKVKLCRKYNLNKIPSNTEILLNATQEDLKKINLMTKPVRTISGVAVIALMTKPIPCQKEEPCTYCPGGPDSIFGNMPQSYTGKEPATMRGIRNKFDPYLQVFNRLEQYIINSHCLEKVELIIMGGTFPSFKKSYQKYFIKYAFKALNDFSKIFLKPGLDLIKFKKFFELPADINNKTRIKRIQNKILKIKDKCDLEKEQIKNEKAKIRCIGLTIETSPNYGKLEYGNEMLRLGATRVELGIQSVYNDILKKVKRGHTTKDSIESIRILKDLGFKINIHYMPGLPATNKEKDLAGMKQLFTNPDYRPDMLKIYPCMVLKGTELYEDWKKGKYKPLTTKEAAELIVEFKKSIPTYCRIQRIQRDIPSKVIEAGVNITNLRQYIHNNYKVKCHCIRCREIGRVLNKNKNIQIKDIQIKINPYHASKGDEFFISAEDIKNDILFGYCRLRFPSQTLRPEITKDAALIRELHVYAQVVPIGETSKHSFQHRGLGKKLLKTAEEISLKNKKTKVIIISGIGVRQYFRKFGYKKEGPYMGKRLVK